MRRICHSKKSLVGALLQSMIFFSALFLIMAFLGGCGVKTIHLPRVSKVSQDDYNHTCKLIFDFVEGEGMIIKAKSKDNHEKEVTCACVERQSSPAVYKCECMTICSNIKSISIEGKIGSKNNPFSADYEAGRN